MANKRQKHWARILAWVLCILMMSGVITVAVSLIMTMLAK